jgi:hypothetical protein
MWSHFRSRRRRHASHSTQHAVGYGVLTCVNEVVLCCVDELYYLAAIGTSSSATGADSAGDRARAVITPLGKLMAAFPVVPRMAKVCEIL